MVADVIYYSQLFNSVLHDMSEIAASQLKLILPCTIMARECKLKKQERRTTASAMDNAIIGK